MRVTEAGTIELVEEGRPIPGLGGIGLFGTDPDGSVETQTNRTDEGRGTVSDGGDGTEVVGRAAESGTTTSEPQPRTEGANEASRSPPRGPSERDIDPRVANAGPEASPSTDGGTTPATGRDPITETALHKGEPDSYCGNCRHFQYVMDGDDIEPYCTYHEELLDDMEACPAWVDNG